ncbi:hypothetical protein ACHQM5_024162 [Ranunculus cassubicifolius]
MVISSNKSPSPTIRKENLDSRTQEIGMRKSFNGNFLTRHSRPATPANSPSEFTRRSLGQKEGLRGSCEFKENEKDQKKMMKESKGTKSFMAPTISAISKISPSPRKKVLAERNELVRSSVSESEGKNFMGGDLEVEEDHVLKPEIGVDSQVISYLSEPHENFYKPRALEFEESEPDSSSIAVLIPETVSIAAPPMASPSPSLAPKYDSAPCSKARPLPLPSPSSAMAPLDSDPHMPPYDPKTNYLSPRPQFLHYRPKLRTEVKKLEDSLPSDTSFSDTETTEEDTLSSGSFKESEEDSSSEVLSEISSTEPNYSQSKVSRKSKSRSCFRSKSIFLLLVFALAALFIPVAETPVLTPSVSFKDQTFKFDDELATMAKFARENLDGLASNLKIWSAQTFSYVSDLISSPKDVADLGPSLQFRNWTIPSEPIGYDEYQYQGLDNVEIEIEGEEITELEMVSDGEDSEMVTEGGEMPLEEVVCNVESQMGEEVHSVVIEDFEMAAEDGDELQMEEVVNDIESLMREEVYSVVTEEHSPMIEVESLDFPPENSELNVDYQSSEFDFSPTEVPELDVLPEMTELDSSSAQFVDPDTTSLDASSQIQTPELISLRQDMYPPTESTELNGESQTAAVNVMENTFSVQQVVAAISAVFAMVATSVYCYLKHKKPIAKCRRLVSLR